jgi:histidine phosphotransferase ChpT
MQLDPGVIDQLISRLLHDLIGPVSATLNGIELVEEFGPRTKDGISQEALDLASSSARLSADRLMYFRLAFGGAGNGEEHSLQTVRQLAETYLTSRKIDLEMSTDANDAAKPPAGARRPFLA